MKKNIFDNCHSAIETWQYANRSIIGNDFTAINNSGQRLGITAWDNFPGGTSVINNNHFNHVDLAIWDILFQSPFNFNGYLINGNTFTNCGKTTSTPSGVAYLIFGGWGSGLNLVLPPVNFLNNTFINCVNGFGITNYHETPVNISNNVINTLKMYGGSAILVQNCNKAKISDNLISSDYNSIPNYALSNLLGAGIRLQNSKDCEISCNTITNTETCIAFEGNCSSTFGDVLYNNDMSSSFNGLTFTANGKIGQQGDINKPTDNVWNSTGSGFAHSQTLIDNSTGSDNIIFTRNGGNFEPTANINSNPALYFNKVDIQTTNGNHAACGTGGTVGTPISSAEKVLEEWIKDADEYLVLEEETEWLNKKAAFQKLFTDPKYSALTDINLINFKDSILLENLGKSVLVEELIKAKNYIAAKGINNSIAPENQIEENNKTYSTIYTLWAENNDRKFSTQEVEDIRAIAYQCYPQGGESVLRARAFLCFLTREPINYNDNCPISSGNSQRKRSNAAAQLTSTSSAKIDEIIVGPNPAQNFVTLNNSRAEELKIVFKNASGIECLKTVIASKSTTLDINSLSNGVYFYEISDGSRFLKSAKIVVIK